MHVRLARRVAGALLFSAAATPALSAGVVPLCGVFGNIEGCRAYETGNPRGDYLMLTDDTFSSKAIGCSFQAQISIGNATFTVGAVCTPGGAQTVQVVDHGAGGYGFVDPSGVELGPLVACAPPKITGSLSRMQA